MGVFYTAGETKIRPGVYQRYSNAGGSQIPSALNGVCAIVITASWGPIGTVTTHESSRSIEETYGSGESVDVAKMLIAGGASKVHIVRAAGASGSEGEAGTSVLEPNMTLNSKYAGSRQIKVKVAANPADATLKNVYVLEGTSQLEKFEYTADATDEREAFMAAVAASQYITAVKGDAEGVISEQEVTLTGTDPEPSTDEYEDAFYALEPYDYNVIVTDKATNAYNNLLVAYIDEAYKGGKFVMSVVGELTTGDGKVDFATRCANAKVFNNKKVVYMGSGWINSENQVVDGAKAVAYTAGLVAGTPSTQSIVHAIVSGAVELIDKLTNAQHETAIKSGMLTLSMNSDRQIWYDSGVNTLITPAANQDEGWKKIKRVKTRFEVMYRVDKAVAPKVGKVRCDADGIADIIQTGRGVLHAMCAEKKIKAGYDMYLDPDLGYSGDSAWFIIAVDDIDTLEKIYLHYHFRYTDAV